MRNKMRRSDHFETFTWIIEDFTKQNIIKLCSKPFKIRGYTWRLLVYPLRSDVNHFSIYLMVADSLPPYGWTRNTYFKLALINQIDRRKSIEKVTQQKFKGGHTSWGSFFMNLNDFYDYKQGYLVRNTCIIEAHICVSNFAPLEYNNNNNNLNSNIVAPINDDSMIFNQQTEHRRSLDDERATLTPSTSSSSPGSDPPDQDDDEIRSSNLTLEDLLDYHTLGPQEKESLIPLLEEVCTLHPSLLQSQRNRTKGFRTWAFKSLGQVLHFLKTKKVKDITEDDIKNLKGLWDELVKSSGFDDLAWLEPFVQSAFGVKSHLQSAKKLRKLKDIVVSLEIKMKKLRGELAAAEAEFQVARRDLSEVRKGFQKIDVNATIGYMPCSR